MATGDIWRLAFTGTYLGSEYVNVWHVRMKSEAGTASGAIAVIKTNWYDIVKTTLTNDWSLTLVHCRKLVVPGVIYDEGISVQGAGAQENLPPQCSMVITLRTGLVGRSRRGRLYQGGFGENAQAEGTWDPTVVSGFATTIEDLLANIGSGGSSLDYEWGVWSRKLGGEDPGPYDLVAGFRPITGVAVRSTVYTQRRRVSGVGR